jgi:hypothetical protein
MSAPPISRRMPAAIVVAMVSACLVTNPLFGQTSDRTNQKPSGSTVTDSTQDSVATPRPAAAPRHSRFGRFGSALESAASTVQKKTGISGGTAARIALTAATGGAAASLLNSSGPAASAASAASAAKQATALATIRATQSAAASAASQSLIPGLAATNSRPGSANSEQAMRAAQDLSQIATRASQRDPGSMRAMAALNAAMTAPNSEFAQFQRQASAGDPAAARKMLIREDQIARAALGGSHP